MGELRLTVVMKSDLAGFTRASGLLDPARLGELLDAHLAIARAALEPHGGVIVKGEGDAFWVTFSAVAAAARAAVAMRDALRDLSTQRPDTGLKARFAITVGDVLHQDGDIFGPAVNLAARIESITPVDAIHLDDAAWTALGDREFEGSAFDSFVPKGFDRTVTVYRVEPRGSVRRFTDEVVMFTDMGNFTRFVADHERDVDLLRRLFVEWDRLHQEVAAFGGRVRVNVGDSFMVMLPSVAGAVEFFAALHAKWRRFTEADPRFAALWLRASVNLGDYVFLGPTVIGSVINDAARALSAASRQVAAEGQDGLLVLTAAAAARLDGTSWAASLEPMVVDLPQHHTLGDRVFGLRPR